MNIILMIGTWMVIMFHLDNDYPHLDSVPLVPSPRVCLIRGELRHHVGVEETNLQKNQETIKIQIQEFENEIQGF